MWKIIATIKNFQAVAWKRGQPVIPASGGNPEKRGQPVIPASGGNPEKRGQPVIPASGGNPENLCTSSGS